MNQAGRKLFTARSPKTGERAAGHLPVRARTHRLAVLLILPTLILLVGLAIYPTLYALWTSLRIYLLYNPAAGRFVGLSNYTHLFADGFAVKSLWLTGLWAVMVIVLQMSLGMALALLLDRSMRAAGLLRTLFIVPVFISPIAMGLTWRFMFEPVSGLVNWALRQMGFSGSLWLSSPNTALISVLIADTWQWTPFVGLILLAGIQSISTEVAEAARLDKVRGFFYLRKILLPLIWPVVLVVVLIRLVDSIRVFDLFYIMTRGGPGSSTLVSSVYGFTMFQTGRLSDMAALGVVILIVINILVTLVLRLLYRQEKKGAAS
jgi:multiple sugar transport system permease protein